MRAAEQTSAHNGRVRTQHEREEQTLAIGPALGLFVLIAGLGLVVLWLLDSRLGVDDDWRAALGWTVITVAATVATAHLIQSSNR